MSYEGFEQHICSNGHYFCVDALYSTGWSEDGRIEPPCPHCKAPSAWWNAVDETNGPDQGIVPEKELERFIIKPPVYKTCDVGCSHLITPAVYRVPTREETKPLRKYYDE